MRLLLGVIFAAVLWLPVAQADWQPDPTEKLQVQARGAVDRMRDKNGEVLQPYFDKAFAYAVFPKVSGGGFVYGFNGGKGIVVEGDRVIGYTRQRRFSLGPQIGFQVEAQIIFFRDADSLEKFKLGNLEFTPQASVNIGKAGGAANAGFDSRVAVFSMTEKGAMLEVALGATKYKYRPVGN
jgi:lipid-binding SYLF domain-containing protein